MKTLLYLLLFPSLCLSQVDVAEMTLKVPMMGEESLYYAFAAGDNILLNLEVLEGKELKEFEILEYPEASRFMDYKTTNIRDKRIAIAKTGIYKFRFYNSSLGKRICKLKIQRVPESEKTRDFNTAVLWKTVQDTTYTISKEEYLARRDTAVVNVVDQIAKVHSFGNLNGNRTAFNFVLPPKTVAWSYYIGVDQQGQQVYEKAAQMMKSTVFESKLVTSPVNAIALGLLFDLPRLQTGEDIDFYITDNDNATLFNIGQPFRCFKKGKVINDYGRMTAPTAGMLNFCFSNDNALMGVTVAVKVSAITVTEIWATRDVKSANISSRQEPYMQN